jgi:cell division protein FtsA
VQEQLLACIDVGFSETSAILGQLDREGHLHVVGATRVPTHGVARGGITDMDEAAHSIATVVERLHQLTGQSITSAYFSLTGTHIDSCNQRGTVAITPGDRDINIDDIQRVLDIAGAVTLKPDLIPLMIIPRTYAIDGQGGIKNPIGMSGHRLEVEAHIISGLASAHRNLLKCATLAGIEVEDVVVAPLASAEAVLSPGEREMGAILIDIGGNTADIAAFADGGIWRTAMLPFGGQRVTADISYVLRLPLVTAEALKLAYGNALPQRIPENETIDLALVQPGFQRTINRRYLASIIHACIDEILIMIRDKLRESGNDRIFAGGVVLTGGTAELPGIVELAEHIFEAPVRIGKPHSLYGTTETIVHPSFATAVGLLRFQEQAILDGMLRARNERTPWQQFADHLRHFFPFGN